MHSYTHKQITIAHTQTHAMTMDVQFEECISISSFSPALALLTVFVVADAVAVVFDVVFVVVVVAVLVLLVVLVVAC